MNSPIKRKNSVSGKCSQKFVSMVFFGLWTNEPNSLITRKPNEIISITSLKESLASVLGSPLLIHSEKKLMIAVLI